MHRVKKKMIFFSCLIVFLAVASSILHGMPPAAEPSTVKTGEETKARAVAPVGAYRETTPQALATEFEAFVPPQEGLQPEVSTGLTESTEVPQTAPVQPTAQNESAKPSTESPQADAKPSAIPQNGDKRTVDGQKEIWILGFGWVPDHSRESDVSESSHIAGSTGDIDKMVGYIGSDDPPKREAPLSEPYVPQIGDVQVDMQTGIQEVFTENGWMEQNSENE